MSQKFIKTIFILVSIITSSCSVYREYDHKILLPPEINTPSNLTNIIIVDAYFNSTTDSLNQMVTYNNILGRDSSDYKKSISEGLYDGFYDNISTLLAIDSIHHKTLNRPINQLNWSMIDRICTDSKSQLLISIDSTIIKTKYDLDCTDLCYVDIHSMFESLWTIYIPFKHIVIDKSKVSDYLSYFEEDATQKLALKKLPPRKELFYDAAYLMASKYTKLMSPKWKDVKREYFVTGEKRMMAADYFLKNKDWKSAIQLWESILKEEDKHLSARALFNIALAYEIQGDLEKANIYIQESLDYYKNNSKDDSEYQKIKDYSISIKSMIIINTKLDSFFDN